MPVHLDLLDALAATAGVPVGRDSLCSRLSLTEDELQAEVERLRKAGYVVLPAHPHGAAAYRLVSIPDRLFAHEIRRHLTTLWVGRRIESLAVCTSTNDEARQLLADGAPSGTLVVAEAQTAGRGRAGRAWHSPEGPGLYLSLILRPAAPLASIALLQATTAVAVAHGVMRATGCAARLRWPNDVLIDGRKVAGLLVEATDVGREEAAFVVGVGLNVNHAPEDFPAELERQASSLAIAAERRLDRRAVLATLLASLEEWYDRMAEGRAEDVARAWRPLSSLLGRQVALTRGAKEVAGRVLDLSPIRGIRLRTANGEEIWIPAEHVSFIRAVTEE